MNYLDFVHEQRVTISKIEKIENIWMVTPEDANEFIFIPASYCTLNQPPKKWWPWKKQTLFVKRFCGQIFYAQIDDTKLFELTETNISENQKEMFTKILRKKAIKEAYDEKLKNKLSYYIQNFLSQDIEGLIGMLPTLMRGYLKLHFYANEDKPYEVKKVHLMLKLFAIADKIFTRHVDESVPFSYLQFAITGFPHYMENPKAIKKEELDIFDSRSMFWQEEIDRLLRKELPPTENERIYSYLNFEVRKILKEYLHDILYLKETWKIEPKNFSSADYKMKHQKLKLLRHSNLIISAPQEDEVKNFISSYVI